MKAEFIIGICVSNSDPKRLGRIRAIPLTDLGKYATLKQILDYVNSEDIKAENNKIYKPWYRAKKDNYTEKDKFLCEPFLPKNIGVTPNIGQLVKIIEYTDHNQAKEFLGPFTIDQITLTEEFRNVVDGLEKREDLSAVLPKVGKTLISGYQNEQIILGDNGFIIRVSHIDQNKNLNQEYPFIQLSKFDNSYNITKEKITEIINEDAPIDYILQLYIDYSASTGFIGTTFLYDTSTILNDRSQIGITKNTLSNKQEYITKNTDNFVVKHNFSTKNFTDFTSIFDTIIKSYQSKKIAYFDTNSTEIIQVITNTKHRIVVDNRVSLKPNMGGANSGATNIVDNLNNWVFRIAPTINISNFTGVILGNDYNSLGGFISQRSKPSFYGRILNNLQSKTLTYEKSIPTPLNKELSANIFYSDKTIFLSSLTNKNVIKTDSNSDGIDSKRIGELINRTEQELNTFGTIRGENLLLLLLEFLDVLKNHGHIAGVNATGSIIEPSSAAIDKLKQKINDELNVKNENGIIINHNFRHN